MTNKEKILLELQILTETITDDIDYMVFLLLKDGLYFKPFFITLYNINTF